MIVEVGDAIEVDEDREALFVIAYTNCFNGAKSAIEAGYAEDGAGTAAWRLLKRERVVAAIETELRRRARALRIEGIDVVNGIFESIRRCIAKGDEKTAMKGWELLGKFCGIFEKDNAQRAGAAEVEAARVRLRERLGIDVSIKPLSLESSKEPNTA